MKQALGHWSDAPIGWKRPIELPIEGLFRLDADHPIHQDFGELSHTGAVPRWQSDEDFQQKVSAWQMIQGTEQELRVLQREKTALMIYATEEFSAIEHALIESRMCFVILFTHTIHLYIQLLL